MPQESAVLDYIQLHWQLGLLKEQIQNNSPTVLILHKFKTKTILIIFTRNANVEKHKNMRPKSHTKYDTHLNQGVVMTYFIKRNGVKINDYCKDQNVLTTCCKYSIFIIIGGAFLVEFSYFKTTFLHSFSHLKGRLREVEPQVEQLKLKRTRKVLLFPQKMLMSSQL